MESLQVDNFLNPTTLAVLYSVGLGGILWSFYSFIQSIIMDRFNKEFMSQIEISNQDNLYDTVLEFINKIRIGDTQNMHFDAKLKRVANNRWGYLDKQMDQDREKPTISYDPKTTNFFILHQKIYIYVTLVEKEQQKVGWDKKEITPKNLILQSYGKHSIKILKELCQEALQFQANQKLDKTNIYNLHPWYQWDLSCQKSLRPLSSIVLSENLADKIKKDIIQFQNNHQWYKSRGVPYKRGYLLFGPPGSGKSSFVQGIAGELGMNICLMSLTGNDISENSLMEAFQTIPLNSLVLLEDVDSIFQQRVAKDGSSKISFSGLLNALDGIRTAEGRILFMTTNHKDRLDPALLRPGRADVHIELGNANQNQINRLFLNFFGNEYESQAKQFSCNLPENLISMASLQGHFQNHKDQPQSALEDYKSLLDVEKFDHKKLLLKEWINLEKYYDYISFKGVKTLEDLLIMDSEQLEEEFQIHNKKDKFQLINYVTKDKNDEFQLIKEKYLLEKFNLILQKENQIKKVFEEFEENNITQYQLNQIIINGKLYNNDEKKLLNDIQESIKKQQIHNSQYRSNEIRYVPKIDFDVLSFLKSINMDENYEKLKENELIDPEIFLNIDSSEILEIMKIEKSSQKKLFQLRYDKIKENINNLFVYQEQKL